MVKLVYNLIGSRCKSFSLLYAVDDLIHIITLSAKRCFNQVRSDGINCFGGLIEFVK